MSSTRRKKLKDARLREKHLSDDISPAKNNSPLTKQSINGEVKISGSVEVFETKSAIGQHESEERRANAYKESTRNYEQSSLKVARSALLATLVTALITILYFVSTWLIFRESKRSADAATVAAETAAQQLELSERPWIRVDMQLNAPLTFDKNGLNTSSIITMTNIGNSVAVNLGGQSELVLQPFGPNREFLRAKQDALCESLKATNEKYGDSLFPKGLTSRIWNIGVSRKELEEAGKAAAGYGASREISPVIIGCAVYKSTFNNAQYFTAMALLILGKGENGAGMPIKIEDTAVVSSDKIFTGIPPYESVRVK